MNILILYKNIEDKDIIKDLKNNNVYFLNQKEYSYKKVRELKNEKDIQIIIYVGRNSFLLNIYLYFFNIGKAFFKLSLYPSSKVMITYFLFLSNLFLYSPF